MRLVLKAAPAVTVVLAVIFVAPSAHGDVLRACAAPIPNAGRGPQGDRFVPFGNVRVNGMSCTAALKAIRNGHMNPKFHTAGYTCRVTKRYQIRANIPGGFIAGQVINCTSGSKRFKWAWST